VTVGLVYDYGIMGEYDAEIMLVQVVLKERP
jgi:hypothetical protein